MRHSPVLPTTPWAALAPVARLRWPSGDERSVAVMRAEPAELTARYGIQFERSLDDLDSYWAAALQLSSGRPVLFIRYDGSPHPGTEVLADSAESPAAVWDELRVALALDESAAAWRPDDVPGASA